MDQPARDQRRDDAVRGLEHFFPGLVTQEWASTRIIAGIGIEDWGWPWRRRRTAEHWGHHVQRVLRPVQQLDVPVHAHAILSTKARVCTERLVVAQHSVD